MNQQPGVRPPLRTSQPIRFYDTTLRDGDLPPNSAQIIIRHLNGEQTVGVVLDPPQKLELARQLDALGISRIEAGFPRVSSEDGEAIQLILKKISKPKSRDLPAPLESTFTSLRP